MPVVLPTISAASWKAYEIHSCFKNFIEKWNEKTHLLWCKNDPSFSNFWRPHVCIDLNIFFCIKINLSLISSSLNFLKLPFPWVEPGHGNKCPTEPVWLRLIGRGLKLRNHNVASEKEQLLTQTASPDVCRHSTPRTLLVTKAAPPASAGGARDTERNTKGESGLSGAGSLREGIRSLILSPDSPEKFLQICTWKTKQEGKGTLQNCNLEFWLKKAKVTANHLISKSHHI